MLLVAHVWVEECMGDARESKVVQLVVGWKWGHDAQAFERVSGHVGRRGNRKQRLKCGTTCFWSISHMRAGVYI